MVCGGCRRLRVERPENSCRNRPPSRRFRRAAALARGTSSKFLSWFSAGGGAGEWSVPRIPVVIDRPLAVFGGRRRWRVKRPETSLRNHGSAAGGAVATPSPQYLAAPTLATHSTGPTPHRVRHTHADRGTYTPRHDRSAWNHRVHSNTNVMTVWAWMLLSSSALKHDRYYGLGMAAFIMECTRTRSLLWFGHGCTQDRVHANTIVMVLACMLSSSNALEHERKYRLAMGPLIIERTRTRTF